MACLPTYKNKRYDNINELLEVIRAEMPTTFESSLKAFITPKKTSKPSFIDFPIIETEDIINFEGKKGAAQYDRDNKVIKVNRNLLKEKFKEKAWTKPRELMETLNGEQVKSFAQALPPDQFKTYNEWEQFVINHEYEHSLYSREDFDREFPNKTKGDYESEINRRALSNPRTFGISVSIQQPSRKTHSGKIEKLEPNQIFVFGSNIGSSKGGKPTHGSGAAKLAKEKFGAIQGQPRGIQGQSYAIVTKKYYDVERSSTPAEIIEELKGLYTFATQNPDKEFLVSDYSKSNLNGYTGLEMAKMFIDAGPIPSNVVLSKDFQKQVDSVSPVLQQPSTQGEIDNTPTPIKGLNERLDSYGYSELVLSPDFYKGEKPKVELSGFKNLFAILRENITRLADINWNTFDFILSKKDIEKLNSLKSIAKELDTINTLKINDNTTRTVDVEKRYAYLSNKLVNDFVDIISVYVEQQLGKTITSSKPRIITKAPVQTETQPTLKTLGTLVPAAPVKPGVEELFEENKELADAVYEAAGFINTSEIQLDKPRFNPDNVEATSYPIKINNKYAGVISVDKDGYISSSIGMAGVELEKEFQNKGYGTKVYIALAEQLAKEGKTLKSEAFGKNLINESANRVWKSLLDKGYAIDRGNYYEVVNVITPQQKQQVQQLYSSYLDTIFPDSKVKDIVYHGSKYGSLDIKNIKDYRPSVETNRVGLFFSERKDIAKVYSREVEKTKTIEEIEQENEMIKGLDKEEREWYFRGKSNMKKEKLPVFSAIINLSNPKQISLLEWDNIIARQKHGKPIDGKNLKDSLKLENYNSIKIPSFLEGFEKFKNKEEFMAYRDKKGFYNLPQSIQDKYFEEYREVDKNIADYYANQYAVFEPEQIHILGSKSDIEGFKEYVRKETQPEESLFNSSFTVERQKEIVSNFALKHKMSEEQAIEYINQAVAQKGQQAIDKLKECY